MLGRKALTRYYIPYRPKAVTTTCHTGERRRAVKRRRRAAAYSTCTAHDYLLVSAQGEIPQDDAAMCERQRLDERPGGGDSLVAAFGAPPGSAGLPGVDPTVRCAGGELEGSEEGWCGGSEAREVTCIILGDDGIPVWGSEGAYPGAGGFGGVAAGGSAEGAGAATPVRAVATVIGASCQVQSAPGVAGAAGAGAGAGAAAAAMGAAHSWRAVTSSGQWQVGDAVEARWRLSSWCPAVVSAVHDNGTFMVDWEDGDTTDRHKSAKHIRSRRRGGAASPPPRP